MIERATTILVAFAALCTPALAGWPGAPHAYLPELVERAKIAALQGASPEEQRILQQNCYAAYAFLEARVDGLLEGKEPKGKVATITYHEPIFKGLQTLSQLSPGMLADDTALESVLLREGIALLTAAMTLRSQAGNQLAQRLKAMALKHSLPSTEPNLLWLHDFVTHRPPTLSEELYILARLYRARHFNGFYGSSTMASIRLVDLGKPAADHLFAQIQKAAEARDAVTIATLLNPTLAVLNLTGDTRFEEMVGIVDEYGDSKTQEDYQFAGAELQRDPQREHRAAAFRLPTLLGLTRGPGLCLHPPPFELD